MRPRFVYTRCCDLGDTNRINIFVGRTGFRKKKKNVLEKQWLKTTERKELAEWKYFDERFKDSLQIIMR